MRLPPDDATLVALGDEFLVECPRCGRQARVLDRGAQASPRIALTCVQCGLARTWEARGPGVATTTDLRRYVHGQVTIGAAVDWYFHLPLWLRAACCGETLWAYNRPHLEFIEVYVAATLREHQPGEHGWSNQSLRNRLPAWMKKAKNRQEILKCTAALKDRL